MSLALIAALGVLVLIPSSASALVTRAPLPFSPITGTGTGVEFNAVSGVAVDETNGNLFVGNGFGNNVVDIFSATGGIPTGVASPYQITGFHFFAEPIGMAIDNSSPASASKGALYVGDSENFSTPEDTAMKYVRNGGTEKYEFAASLHPSSGPSFNQPIGGVAVSKTGNVFFSDWGSGSVLEFSPTGTEIARINVQPSVGRPSTLAIDAAGDLFVGEYQTGRIVKYLAADLTPGDISPPFAQVSPASAGAKGLAVDQTTNTLFVGVGNHVQEYDAATLAKGSQFGAGSIDTVASIAVNSATERIYIADRGFPAKIEAFGPIVTLADVTTGNAPEKTGTRATVEGSVNPQNVAVTDCKVEYGTSNSYGKTTPCEGAIPTDAAPHAVTGKLTDLIPNGVTYHYRVVATNVNGKNAGADKTFDTPNTVITGVAVSQSASTALLKGTVNPDTVPITECKFELTKESDFLTKQFSGATVLPCEQSPGSGTEPVEVSALAEGLTQSTDYRYRLVAANANGLILGEASQKPLSTKGPQIKNAYVSFPSITAKSAVLVGVINAEGEGTSYHFEYVTQANYEQSGYAGATSVPAGIVGIGHGTEDVTVTPTLAGLAPETKYHARLVVTNPTGTVMSNGLEFGTFPDQPLAPCANDELREGSALPDCRAYEQVSPQDKDGNIVKGESDHVQASVDGNSIIYESKSGIPGGEGEQNFPMYVSQRGGTDWSTHGTLPNPLFGIRNTTTAWSEDLNMTFNAAGFYPSDKKRPEGVMVLHDILSGVNTPLWSPHLDGLNRIAFVGATADDQRIFFDIEAALPGVVGTPPANEGSNLYEFNRETEELRVVGLLPESDGGGVPPGGVQSGADLRYTQSQHWVSEDGDTVFFKEPEGFNVFSGSESGQLFVRTGLNGGSSESALLNKSHKTEGQGPGGVASNSPASAAFQMATPDGKYAFFTSPEELTNDANTGPEPPLPPPAAIGRANIDGTNRNATFIPTTAQWVTQDSTYIYWSNEEAGTIGRAEIGGGNPNPNFITGLDHPKGIAVDAGHIYWAEARDETEGNGTIGRAEIGGGNPNMSWITGASDPRGITVTAEFVYWTNGGNTDVARATIAGASPNQSFISRGGGEHPWGITATATHLYWIDQEGSAYIIETNLTGGGENYIYAEGNARAIIADSGHLYWSRTSDNAIGRTGLNLFGIEANFISGLSAIYALSVDAGHIYWTAPETTPPPSPGNDLYAYESETGELTDLTVDNGDVNGAQVLGVAGASSDGSTVYFAANGDLDGGGPATTGNCTLEGHLSGQCGLYVWNNGSISYIAKVCCSNIGLREAEGGLPTSLVSEDGGVIVFQSGENLTSYDSKGVREFYRYELGAETLQCITCTPTGAPPAYAPYFNGPELQNLPPGLATNTQALRLRNLSSDGNRFFFQTTEKLVPEDINGDSLEEEGREGQVGCKLMVSSTFTSPTCQDVYEWEAGGTGTCDNPKGCFYLLSSGDTEVPSYFADAGANGDDAYFFSFDTLVPQDRDQLQDVYDVRVDGGLKAQHPENPPPCEGDGCRNEFTPVPPVNGAGTAVLEGPENPAPVHKCKKGFVKKHGECVKAPKKHKAKKRHHGKRHHRRHANTNGGSRR